MDEKRMVRYTGRLLKSQLASGLLCGTQRAGSQVQIDIVAMPQRAFRIGQRGDGTSLQDRKLDTPLLQGVKQAGAYPVIGLGAQRFTQVGRSQIRQQVCGNNLG